MAYPLGVPIRILAARRQQDELFEPPLRELPALLDDPDVVVWVAVASPDPAAKTVLEDAFGFHPLVVEDALNAAYIPKLEDHRDYLYVIFHGLTAEAEISTEVELTDLDVFLGDRFVVTHEGRLVPAVDAVLAKVRKDPRILSNGPAAIVHELFDYTIDRFAPLMERLDREVELLESAILGGHDVSTIERIFGLKHSLQRLRRLGLHQREILLRLSSVEMPLVPAEKRPFFRDVYDHFVRVIDQTESYREMVSSSLEAHLSMQSHRMNEIMKLLTMLSTIMLPLNFVAALYGMNFDHMPGLHWEYGYPAAWLVMGTVALTMYVFFRRKRWL